MLVANQILLKHRQVIPNSLILKQSDIGDVEFKIICDSIDTKILKQLKIDENHLSFNGIVYLCNYNWSDLVSLSLKQNKIGNFGCKYLSRSSLRNLKQLSLDRNKINSEGMLHLCKSQWANLQIIRLGGNMFQTNALNWLAKLNCKQIRKVDFYDYGMYLTKAEMKNLLLAEWKSLNAIELLGNIYSFEDNELLRRLMTHKNPNAKIDFYKIRNCFIVRQ